MTDQLNQALTFFVPGTPIAQGRPRAFMRGKHVGVYNPTNANEWKDRVTKRALEAREQCGWVRVPQHVPVSLSLLFVFKRPQAHFGSGRNAGKLKAGAPRFHTVKPDRDNLEKAVMDALKWADIFHDDSQVVSGRIIKRYHAEREGALIRLGSGDGMRKADIGSLEVGTAADLNLELSI